MVELGDSQSLESLFEVAHLTEIEFEEQWGDPMESENTELEEVPESATIDFGNGTIKDATTSFIIKRAMVDPDATVYPDDE